MLNQRGEAALAALIFTMVMALGATHQVKKKDAEIIKLKHNLEYHKKSVDEVRSLEEELNKAKRPLRQI